MTEFFPQAPMLPYYKYSGQDNLFTPRGYAQGTLVDLLSSRNLADETEEIIEGTTEQNQPAFEEVQDSDKQSFFGGMDINEGDNLSFDDLSDLSLTDGLFGGITVSDNAPRGWNTQHQREFDALRAAGLKPSAKWTGSDWYVFAKELDGTPFGEPGTMSLADSFTSGGKYGGSPMTLFGKLGSLATGSYNPAEVFEKNLQEVLVENPDVAFGGPGGLGGDVVAEPIIEAPTVKEAETILKNTTASDVRNDPVKAVQVEQANKVLGVTAKQGGTVTAKEGGTVKAKEPPKPVVPKPVVTKPKVIAPPPSKPKPVVTKNLTKPVVNKTVLKTQKQKTDELRKSIEAAVAAAKQKEKDNRSEEAEKNKAAQATARKQVDDIKKVNTKFTRGGYGF